MYYLDFPGTLTLISGYDAVLRSRVFNRWMKLERGIAAPAVKIPTSLPEALRLYADEVEKKELAEKQRNEAIRTKAYGLASGGSQHP